MQPLFTASSITYEDQIPEKPPKYETTYEELRKKNREEYNQRQSQSFTRQAQAPAPVSPPAQRQAEDPPMQEPARNGPKNKYGDVWSP
jgi:hypothetical protein